MKKIGLLLLLCMVAVALSAQEPLPDPLIASDGHRITSPAEWYNQRRPELRDFFERNMYGRAPQVWTQIRVELLEQDPNALEGLATRKQYRIFWNGMKTGPHADVLVYLPNKKSGKVPVVIGLNFEGNHSVIRDTMVRIPASILAASPGKPVERGFHYGQWPVYEILKRGYGVATAWRNEVSMDNKARAMEGVRSVYPELAEGNENWATVSAWAWGTSRIADLMLSDERVDPDRLAVIGFSRLGKAALWTGATDNRFMATISECSGAGGAKLLRNFRGEKISNLTGPGFFWFCRNFAQYSGKDNDLPFDSHEMMALIAPRALYVASATQDGYADPPSEYQALQLTAPVYELLGYPSALPAEFPAPDTPVGAGTQLGYHVRTGKHDVTPQDWQYILDFIDKLK